MVLVRGNLCLLIIEIIVIRYVNINLSFFDNSFRAQKSVPCPLPADLSNHCSLLSGRAALVDPSSTSILIFLPARAAAVAATSWWS